MSIHMQRLTDANAHANPNANFRSDASANAKQCERMQERMHPRRANATMVSGCKCGCNECSVDARADATHAERMHARLHPRQSGCTRECTSGWADAPADAPPWRLHTWRMQLLMAHTRHIQLHEDPIQRPCLRVGYISGPWCQPMARARTTNRSTFSSSSNRECPRN